MDKKKPAKVKKDRVNPRRDNSQNSKLSQKVKSRINSITNQNTSKKKKKTRKKSKPIRLLKGSTKDDFQTSDECSDQSLNIYSRYNSFLLTRKYTVNHGEEKEQNIVEQIEGIDLVKFLNALDHSFFTKRILNSKSIVITIEDWLQHLYCCEKNCPYNAIITYQGESSDLIYCQAHADPSKHMAESINFQNELTDIKILLTELEKELLYVHAKITIAQSENAGDKLDKKFIKDLENKFSVIKETLNKMKEKVENLKEKPKTKKATNKNEEFRYKSLSFVKDDCEKCSGINNEILSIISKNSRKKKIELFIQALDNECKKIQLDEEFKSCPYLEVPDEIYEKFYNILSVPLQSKILVKNLEKMIKNNFKIIETNQKTTEQLAANLNADKQILEAKLSVYRNESKINEEDKDQNQKPSYSEEEKKVLKELSLRDAQFYSEKLGISLEEFKTKFTISSENYSKLGQFQYYQPNLTSGSVQQSIFEICGYKAIYFGQLKEGTEIKEGIGIRVVSNGDIYEGCWRNGKREGKGRYIDNDGEYYIGDYKDGNRHGSGIVYYASGNRYEGEFRDDERNGQCTYYWADGNKYTGEYKDGMRNGQGTSFYTDGSWWTGEWKNEKKNGPGTEYAANGTVLKSGNWVDSEYVGPK